MATLRETVPLRPRKIVKKSIAGTIGSLFFAGSFSIFVYVWLRDAPEFLIPFRRLIAIVWVCLIVVFVSSIPLYQYAYYRRYFYDSDGLRLTIRKGVVAQKEATLPYSRITDVYVDQDVLDVLFGLYDVHISTPTEQSGRFAHIDGVGRQGAADLKKLILERIDRSSQPVGRADELTASRSSLNS